MRAFLALPLQEDVRAELARAASRLKAQPWARDVRWVPRENLHLTLRFLGEIEEPAAEPLLAALGRACADLEPFRCRLAALALFPSRSRPRVVAASLTGDGGEGDEAGEGIERLVALAGHIEEAVVACGFAPEPRRFRAHVTLGRFRRVGRRRIELDAELAPRVLPVRDVVLFRSQLSQDGARYSELGRVVLTGRLSSR